MRFLAQLFGKTRVQTTTAERPFQIRGPSIGFLNLLGADAAALVEADQRMLAPLFKQVRSSTHRVPRCQVLLIYCKLDEAGAVVGAPAGLRNVVKQAGAYVAVVASEHASYTKALRDRNDWHANLVLTLDRRGESFARFLHALFATMFQGHSMLKAWVGLAPQSASDDHPDLPMTLMLAEAGHVSFS
jgi:hypothetical protein